MIAVIRQRFSLARAYLFRLGGRPAADAEKDLPLRPDDEAEFQEWQDRYRPRPAHPGLGRMSRVRRQHEAMTGQPWRQGGR
ncbi:hypothetical protein [Muricoccus radiodurans]|uniref:hypothetical protein n=1 Tax=Muricoccus radiodurans TaxID=2231721 RepID=UPI003CF642FC